MTAYPMNPLYKLDAEGNVRVWYVKVSEDGTWWTVSGIKGGNLVESDPRYCEEKNTGKSNATTVFEQACAEAKAAHEKKQRDGYCLRIEDVYKEIEIPKAMLALKFEATLTKVITPALKTGSVFIQPKFDGFRCLATRGGLYTRSGELIETCEHIRHALMNTFMRHPDMVIDGELYNHDLRDDFNKLSSLLRKKTVDMFEQSEIRQTIEFHVYDGYRPKFIEADYSKRNMMLSILSFGGPLKLARTVNVKSIDDIYGWHDYFKSEGYEGSMIRVDGFGYEAGKRSKSLSKLKDFHDKEFKIVQIEEGNGNWKGAAKRVVCETADGNTFGAGIRGTYEQNAEVLKNADAYAGGEATIRYPSLTPKGIPRFPVATALFVGKRDV
jgi:DNA ligase-1